MVEIAGDSDGCSQCKIPRNPSCEETCMTG
jgi:hypothetical protein